MSGTDSSRLLAHKELLQRAFRSTNSAELDEVAKTHDGLSLWLTVADNVYTSADTLDWLADKGNLAINASVVSNPNTNPNTFEKIGRWFVDGGGAVEIEDLVNTGTMSPSSLLYGLVSNVRLSLHLRQEVKAAIFAYSKATETEIEKKMGNAFGPDHSAQ